MQIRRAKKSDFDAVLDLMQQLNPADPGQAISLSEAFDTITDSDNLLLLVAEIDNRLAGSVYLNLIPNITRGGKPYALIENVITDSAWRRQGIGRALMEHALELAAKHGCYKVMLMSGRKESATHAFYRGCGFDADAKQAYIRRFD